MGNIDGENEIDFINQDEYTELVLLINKISEDRLMYSEINGKQLPYNVKKTRVDHIISEDGIFNPKGIEIIKRYTKEYTILFGKILLEYTDITSQFRVKEPKSIRGKLKRFRNSQEEGRISLNKCLNDILGFRLILQSYSTSEILENEELLIKKLKEDTESSNVKILNARKEAGYVAIHVYFEYNKSKLLPWELQVWSVKDCEKNESLHYEHKTYR